MQAETGFHRPEPAAGFQAFQPVCEHLAEQAGNLALAQVRYLRRQGQWVPQFLEITLRSVHGNTLQQVDGILFRGRSAAVTAEIDLAQRQAGFHHEIPRIIIEVGL